MNFLLALTAIIFMFLVGFVVIKLFKLLEDISDIEKFPYAFGLGLGLCAFQLYLYSRLHVKWDIPLIIIPFILLIIIYVLTKKRDQVMSDGLVKISFIERLSLVVLTVM